MDNNTIITNIYPVIPLRGKVAFPSVKTSFDAGREKTLRALDRADDFPDKTVLILTQRDTDKDEVTPDGLYQIGTVARVKSVTKLPTGGSRVLCEGLFRAKVRSFSEEGGYISAVATEVKTFSKDAILEEAYFRTARALVQDVISADGRIARDVLLTAENTEDPEKYLYAVLSSMRVRLDVKQSVLEENDLCEKLRLFERCLNDELEISKIERKISSSVRKEIEQSQKDFYLREQLKAIHGELGDDGKEEDEYRKKIADKHLPEEVEAKCLKELDRMNKMQPSSPEYAVITGYLDQVLDLPWTEETTDTEKLSDCVAVLEADHYGLEKIKERITEYLAVLKLTGNMKAPILCLVGPPGVGKTSIARSVARALNRKFVRMSLGGVKDEAEIRGHRRTYIGAMPGRILYSMQTAGSINPVFLLDEIDKISSDMRGDPASALLEVLDPEQNSSFRDRFIDLPYDLSKVLFISTANTLETIPSPLRDRMEIIEISGYTLEEKREIAKRYLIPKQLTANGLFKDNIRFSDGGIKTIIEGYTLEAGVRTLERTIGTVCRKVAVKYADDKTMEKVTVNEKTVGNLLGARRFFPDESRKKEEIGAVTGLAWTAVGGTTLTVEATAFKGKGEVRLTGKLGDVMKESAVTALSFVRSHAEKYGIDPDIFENTDIHIHVPEGATPKDGPSAGITLATAILSVLTEKPVRKDIAMTGEITLRGNVLPIGGLKEKALSARRVGIKNVIIPVDNVKDIEEIPETVRKDVTFYPVSSADEVFALAVNGFETVKQKKRKIIPLSDSQSAGVSCKKAQKK